MRIAGIPGRNYDVQSRTNLVTDPWRKVGSVIIGVRGYVIFTDPMGVQDTRTLSGYVGVIQSVEVRLTLTGMLLDYAYNGEWTLFVADMNQNAVGTLDSWGLNVTVVPEPSTSLLLGLGLAALMARRKKLSA